MSEWILEARGIEKDFPGVRALDGVDLQIREGEVHALVGENGAGKSTLMLVLSGIYQPDGGVIYLEGEKIHFSSPHDANHKGISIVFQELSLIQGLSIAENIFANRQPVGKMNMIDWDALHTQTKELLALFDLQDLNPATPVRELSVANQQVIEIIKAISFNPRVLILDEPTSSLTEHEVTQLFENIRKLKKKGLSFIYISHHLSEIFEIADRVSILRDGQYVCSAEVSEIDEDFLVNNMVGRTISNMYGQRKEDQIIGTELLKVENLSRKGFFENISFSIKAGEIVGMAGLVGAGRTEVGRSIFGAEVPESGQVSLDGRILNIKNPKDAIHYGVGYLSEDRKTQGLILDFSITQNLVANHLEDFTSPSGFLNEAHIQKFAAESKDEFGIMTPSLDQKLAKLSGGNQQKVLVGAWMGIKPRLLIVDEPTRGVDVGAKSEIYNLLRNLADRGVGILMISSDLPEILGMSDRILVMQSGKLVGTVQGDQATEESIMTLAAGTVEGAQ
ncbi:sugar ABC transporter ATP-binding protein [Oceanispirochaeta sp.]|jgi:ABC-type sugar transport system ATPase subunit|uniref:sugar ABC transporter ATP-binding protein n=1 Tax=Oceanispirochaeta sp. TaxID=2035350 RepID=UPI00260519CE|nr:sugar ABC transporter ATP-binding protein [Oceanispirochaeta sp.]MDA3955911.1 sugar ABC transporter ATP-binding protein [Oceanispirochaeta sp.]